MAFSPIRRRPVRRVEGGWQVHLAATTDQALEILKDGQVELVVVDVQMPVLDGIQFTGMLQRRYPKIKRAVLTAYASEESAPPASPTARISSSKNRAPPKG